MKTWKEQAVLDPLKALEDNAKRMEQVHKAKITLIKQAVLHGYSDMEIANATGVGKPAVRMFKKRHGITND